MAAFTATPARVSCALKQAQVRKMGIGRFRDLLDLCFLCNWVWWLLDDVCVSILRDCFVWCLIAGVDGCGSFGFARRIVSLTLAFPKTGMNVLRGWRWTFYGHWVVVNVEFFSWIDGEMAFHSTWHGNEKEIVLLSMCLEP